MVGAVLISCENDDDKINTFNAMVDAANASIGEDMYHAMVVFSTDGGSTYVDNPSVKPGDTYLAKVIYRPASGTADIAADGCFVFDWTGSDPAPNGDTNSDVAEFVMQSNSAIKVKVTDYVPYQANWAGDWIGTEDGLCCGGDDANTLTQDPTDPNKFVMDNFWGDHVDAFILFKPSTNWSDQTVSLPEQTTSEGGLASGEGNYDQCRGTFQIATTYILDGDTAIFDYYFHH